MIIFDIIAPPTAPELDRAWFADRRRQYRFRPPFPGERAGAVLVRRDGARYFLDGKPTPARFEMGADEAICALVWRSLGRVGFPVEPPPARKKAGAEAPAEVRERRAIADATGNLRTDESTEADAK